MKPINLLAIFATAVLLTSVHAGAAANHTAAHSGEKMPSIAPASMSEGEVRKIDKEQGKVTLRHGPIPSLDMPGMTMVFRVVDPKLLDNVKEGDRVQFSAERQDGALTLTAIRAMR